MNIATELAHQILDMQDELEFLRRENARLREYKEMYHKEVKGSIEYSNQMIGGLLSLVLSDRIKFEPATET